MKIPHYDRLTWNAVVALHGAMATVLQAQARILNLLETQQVTLDDFTAKIDAINAKIDVHNSQDQMERDTLNAEIARLREELAKEGLTPEEEAVIFAKLEVLEARFTPTPT